MQRIKVIILYNKLYHYRIPVWNLLAEKCELTVAYSEGDGIIPESMECKFDRLFLPYWSIGSKIIIQKNNIRRLVRDYDVVVAYGNIAWLKYSTLPWLSKNKVVFHTIGVSASYKKGYDQKKNWDRIRMFFYKKASALAFYTDYPIEKYKKLGIPKSKMFVAPNTVYVSPEKINNERDSIIMVGTLYKEKGVQVLLDAYYELRDLKTLPYLVIVGGGHDFEVIKKWVSEHHLDDKITLKGPIYDIKEKAVLYSKAIACISPKQAGLTVLESMGYGVPFITTAKAITGGEITNIHNGIDGVILEDETAMVETLRDLSENRERYMKMGIEAKLFYDNNRTINHMANGLWDAIIFAYNS